MLRHFHIDCVFFFAARTRVWKQRGSDHKLAVPAPLTPPTLAQHPSFTHVRRLLAKAEEGATRDPDRTGRSRQESGWCVSPYRFNPPAPPFRAPPLPRTGIQLLQAEDLKTWYFSIEVLGESLYQVCLSTLIFNDPSPPLHSSDMVFTNILPERSLSSHGQVRSRVSVQVSGCPVRRFR